MLLVDITVLHSFKAVVAFFFGVCLMAYVPSIPFISMRVAVGLDSTSFKFLRGGRGFEIQSMILDTAFASGLVTGVLANFPRACQPKRFRRRLRAENAV